MRFKFILTSLVATCLHANPQNASVEAGVVSIQARGQLLEIQASDLAILNWESFSIQPSEITRFLQPSVDAAVLNRVVGGSISELLGQLQANGKVYLINPNGIVIGKDALINTAALLATTLQIRNEEFLAKGALHLFGEEFGTIEHLGTISSASGPVVLLAHKVKNQGTIEAPHVSIGAGSEFLVMPSGETEIFIRPNGSGLVENEGTIEALVVELQSDGAQSLAINHTGIIQADRVSEEGGKVFLRATDGTVHLAKESRLNASEGEIQVVGNNVYTAAQIEASRGEISLSGRFLYCDGSVEAEGGSISLEFEKGITATRSSHFAANTIESLGGSHIFSSAVYEAKGEVGGSIRFSADQIALSAAKVDASGTTQGGKILIGDDAAKSVFVNGSSHILANGGNGEIKLLANEMVKQQGQLSAKDGFVEICGEKTACNLEQIVAGRFLLDPLDVSIDTVGGGYPLYELIDPSAGTGSGFGTHVLSLLNGNVAVAKPSGGASNEGGVYLFDGFSAAFINAVLGSSAGDHVGNGGLTEVGIGNYVIASSSWSSGKGAATFVNGTTGLSGVVSSSNSLVGTLNTDAVSSDGVFSLGTGDYVVASAAWSSNKGAATWGNGTTGTTGAVSAGNSLIGSAGGDMIGSGGIKALTDGNYVVVSPAWQGGKGAVTWAGGANPTSDIVSGASSIVGSAGTDQVGSGGVTALSGGNFVVSSPFWSGNKGAATWGDDLVVGVVAGANSMIGAVGDMVSSGGITALTNGNYVISSPVWSSGTGAATWVNGSSAASGVVGVGNSLVGASGSDSASSGGIAALTNGHYVVASPSWNSNQGAATWGNGTTGTVGTVSSGNSITGSTGDSVSSDGITALTNGNYVVVSSSWGSGKGAATWADGLAASSFVVSGSNSIVGTAGTDNVGSGGVTALSNGNYVIASPNWSSNTGAATWASGASSTSSTVAAGNSITGTSGGDLVSSGGVVVLTAGAYVVSSPHWTGSQGAATFATGTGATSLVVSADNSVVGAGAASGMLTPIKDTANECFIVPFPTEGTVLIGLESMNQLTSGRASSQTVTLSPTSIESLVNAGTSVAIEASNNITISSPLTFVSSLGTTFDLTAGNNITISAALSTTNADLTFLATGDVLVASTVSATNSAISLLADGDVSFTSPVSLITTGTASVTFDAIHGNVNITNAVNCIGDLGTSVNFLAGGDIFVNNTVNTVNGDLVFYAEGNVSIANNLNTVDGDISFSGLGDVFFTTNTSIATSGLGNFTVDIDGDIFFDGLLSLTGIAGTSASFYAGGDIFVAPAIDAGVVDLTLSATGDLDISDNVTSSDGNLLFIAGQDINVYSGVSITTTGLGSMTFVADNLFPSSPGFGQGVINMASDVVLSTNGADLQIYTASPVGCYFPTLINGVLAPGSFQTFGIYYPNGVGGVPFGVFYKVTLSSVFASQVMAVQAALSETLVGNLNDTQTPGGVEGLPTNNTSPCQGG